MFVGTRESPGSLVSWIPLWLESIKDLVMIFACHWFMGISPMASVAPACPPLSLTGVERPSTSMSFHWSNTVILQSPSGRPDREKLPLPSHLVNAKSSPSGSPTLTKHCVNAKLLLSPLL